VRFPLTFILLFSILGLSAGAQSTQTSKPAHKKAAAHKKSPARLSRMRKAFVASASLKPMARQLLQDRSSAAYAGVEGFARAHAATDAGSLAWLVAGYARTLDHDYAGAIEPLNRAKLHAGDLGDYVSFYLGTAYFESGHAPEAVTALAGFDKNFPASLLIRDAYVLEANALLADGRAQDAVTRLEANRLPTRSDLELVLGRAYEAAGQQEKAVVVFRNLYFNFPISPEANTAGIELAKLPAVASLPAPTFADRKNRADLLLKGKRYTEASNAYREVIATASPTDQPLLILTLSEALRKAGQRREASQVLSTLASPTPDVAAQRLFELGEIARAGDDDDGFLSYMAQLRQTAPTSPWLEQALLSAGNIYLLRKDYDHAIDCYRELQARFPAAVRASYAHWKVAWLSLRQGRNAEAKKDFEDQIALYPDSAEVPASLYWRGRLAEEDQDPATARAYYIKTSQRFRNFYYGELSRQRLSKLAPPAGGDVHLALLDHIAPLNAAPKAADAAPEDNLRVQKAHLLENGALLDFAVRELKAAAQQDPGNWLAPEIARMYQDAGRYDLAIQTLKRAEPNYFAVDIPSLPRTYWEALFPKAYWADLKQFSEANNLDPYLVASLIRQESEFNPNAVSKKDAVGLMQLLPRVGKKVAKEEKLKHYTDGQLFTPGVNLEVGTKYFREMVDQFGAVEYALAAYNAGSDRVVDWQAQPKYRDVQEFVESIPFTETREYVEAIVRNANVYRKLYGTP
jgi:soluble lytic murein transglycosylase